LEETDLKRGIFKKNIPYLLGLKKARKEFFYKGRIGVGTSLEERNDV
jgi:hypothetical protein